MEHFARHFEVRLALVHRTAEYDSRYAAPVCLAVPVIRCIDSFTFIRTCLAAPVNLRIIEQPTNQESEHPQAIDNPCPSKWLIC